MAIPGRVFFARLLLFAGFLGSLIGLGYGGYAAWNDAWSSNGWLPWIFSGFWVVYRALNSVLDVLEFIPFFPGILSVMLFVGFIAYCAIVVLLAVCAFALPGALLTHLAVWLDPSLRGHLGAGFDGPREGPGQSSPGESSAVAEEAKEAVGGAAKTVGEQAIEGRRSGKPEDGAAEPAADGSGPDPDGPDLSDAADLV